ncbi:LysR family transcriptional regulator [Phreatobacter stygius]|uniref:LysR family transcriptional regulator n=1 Tax=Phreatobacter stygius TaxID=1940610 RepID=A0A4D7B555_9HYPH|nr:LysR family transcriptional regulator [Phreatobacter stygius]QCI68534.1 LysR family transcriptional regulator [Phreatobacter stygius]
MDFTQLRYFHEVAQVGTIRKASDKLNVAPSALSRQIQQLEHQVGMPLFERHTRGMRLTEAGEIYALHAKLVMMDAERARSELAALRGLERGGVRLVVVEGVVSSYLMEAIGRFRADHPDISFELMVTGTADVVADVRKGDADIGIAFNAKPDPQVEFLFQLDDEVRAMCSPDHPLTRLAKVSLRDVFGYPVAMPVTSFGIRALVDESCRVQRLRAMPALVTNSIDALRTFAKAGIGVSLITGMSCQRDVAAGELVSIRLADPVLVASIDVLVLGGRRLPLAVEAFLRTLRALAAARR